MTMHSECLALSSFLIIHNIKKELTDTTVYMYYSMGISAVPLTCGHPYNQDTSPIPKGVRIIGVAL